MNCVNQPPVFEYKFLLSLDTYCELSRHPAAQPNCSIRKCIIQPAVTSVCWDNNKGFLRQKPSVLPTGTQVARIYGAKNALSDVHQYVVFSFQKQRCIQGGGGMPFVLGIIYYFM